MIGAGGGCNTPGSTGQYPIIEANTKGMDMTRAEGLAILSVVLMAIALVIAIINGRSGIELGVYVAILVALVGLNGRLAWRRRHGAA